jgi:hypothetical protein
MTTYSKQLLEETDRGWMRFSRTLAKKIATINNQSESDPTLAAATAASYSQPTVNEATLSKFRSRLQ